MGVINPSDPADFTPSRSTFKDLRPFRFWCQKVLPLVYDDSLSYYELLCKVVQYLNDTMSNMELAEEDVGKLYDAYDQLQGYTNDYFASLDVTEEINNKLDAMAEDGTLSFLISPLIPDIVTGWLDENITPTTPPIDASLTITGAGADAKVTGDYARDHETRIQDLEYFPLEVTELVLDPAEAEIGATVPEVALGYAFNKAPVTSSIAYGETLIDTGTEMESAYPLGDDFTADTVFAVDGTDAGSPHHSPASASKTATLRFLNKVHYGVAAEAELSDALLLEGLQSHVLTDTRQRTITVNPGSGQHIWYALPDSFGTPKFAVGPLAGGFTLVGRFTHTNAQGYASTYQVWMSDQPNLGNTTVSIT